MDGRPIITDTGRDALRAFEAEIQEKRKREGPD
jgi:hypothetical protein